MYPDCFLSREVSRGKKGMKTRARELTGFEGKCWVEINARRSFILSNSYVKVKEKDSSGISKWILSVLSKAVLIHLSLPGHVYIPEHDLFSDIPVSCKHRGCLVYIIQKEN